MLKQERKLCCLHALVYWTIRPPLLRPWGIFDLFHDDLCTDTSAFKSASITEWMDVGEGADRMTPERGEALGSEVTREGGADALTEDGRKHRMLDVLLGV